jgi:PAS domain S-box-containing protein
MEALAMVESSREAVDAKANSADRFHLLAEVLSLQVWTARPDGELDWANQECVTYFDADLDRDILGHAWAQYVHADDLPIALQHWNHSLTTGERYEVEFRLRRKDGAYRWFLVRAQATRNAEGSIDQWMGTNTDIHHLKAIQSQAEQANRAKDAFLATLSHELRTPLTPVLMASRALREDERLPPDAREQLGMIERNIALEARLIDDLLYLTRIARGQLRLRPEPCDAHSLIGMAVDIVRDDALEKAISIDRDFGALRSGLSADPARFQQVIWNLLRNAVKFTPRGGRVSIRTRDSVDPGEGAELRIEVTDTGIGIESEALDRIFLPFDQGTLSGDQRMGGVGLGLAIARSIVDLHGGTLSVKSAGTGRGATFTIVLPGATIPPPGVADSTELFPELQAGLPEALMPETASRRLLLVEDHDSTLQILSQLLVRAGHQVTTARTVTQALAAAAAGTFDLVISDLGLPDGTGTELMERLRDTYGLSGIALSGYGMEEDIARSLQSGFTAHLIKPVELRQLLRALKDCLIQTNESISLGADLAGRKNV